MLLRTPAPIRERAAPAAWRAYEHVSALRAPSPAVELSDGLPIPPARLRIMASWGTDPSAFLRSGQQESQALRRLVSEHDQALDHTRSVLDFGCGCGRVLRNFGDLERIHACDPNPEAVEWVAANLPFVTVARNEAEPPLPWSGFDVIYALSVFTHFDEASQTEWIAELRRALNPGGLLMFTTQGERFRTRMEVAERQRFDNGSLAVRFPEGEGSNLCSAYHPEAYLDRMLEGFERVCDYRGGVPGVPNGSPLQLQDVHLVRDAGD